MMEQLIGRGYLNGGTVNKERLFEAQKYKVLKFIS